MLVMAARNNDFAAWIGAVLSDLVPGEAGVLYRAVEQAGGLNTDLYSAERSKTGFFIVRASGLDGDLVLTESERQEMLEHLSETYMDGMDPDSFIGYEEALANPNL